MNSNNVAILPHTLPLPFPWITPSPCWFQATSTQQLQIQCILYWWHEHALRGKLEEQVTTIRQSFFAEYVIACIQVLQVCCRTLWLDTKARYLVFASPSPSFPLLSPFLYPLAWTDRAVGLLEEFAGVIIFALLRFAPVPMKKLSTVLQPQYSRRNERAHLKYSLYRV